VRCGEGVRCTSSRSSSNSASFSACSSAAEASASSRSCSRTSRWRARSAARSRSAPAAPRAGGSRAYLPRGGEVLVREALRRLAFRGSALGHGTSSVAARTARAPERELTRTNPGQLPQRSDEFFPPVTSPPSRPCRR
jgi:hypothetical protein